LRSIEGNNRSARAILPYREKARSMENDERARKMDEEALQASALAKETGITLDEERSLIEMIGTDRNSLLREARILKNR
jgi:hypothetical protein